MYIFLLIIVFEILLSCKICVEVFPNFTYFICYTETDYGYSNCDGGYGGGRSGARGKGIGKLLNV